MKRLVVVAILLLGNSISHAAIVDLSFSGEIDYLNDPLDELSAHDLAIGDQFTAQYSIDNNPDVYGSIYSPYEPEVKLYQFDRSSLSMSINFDSSTQFADTSDYGYIGIGNDVNFTTDAGRLITGDIWLLELGSSPSAVDFMLWFFDPTGTALTNDDFFVNDSFGPWSYAEFSFGNVYYPEPYEWLAIGTANVPIPSATWLFGSGLLALGGWSRFGRSN